MQTVIASQTMSLVFRYLFSIRPIRPLDQHAGLWIFCGSDLQGDALASPLTSMGASLNGPAFVVERLDPEMETQALVRTVLQTAHALAANP